MIPLLVVSDTLLAFEEQLATAAFNTKSVVDKQVPSHWTFLMQLPLLLQSIHLWTLIAPPTILLFRVDFLICFSVLPDLATCSKFGNFLGKFANKLTKLCFKLFLHQFQTGSEIFAFDCLF